MIPQTLELFDIQSAFRDHETKLERLLVSDVEMNGRRIVGAGQSISPFDYTTRFELNKAVSELLKQLRATTRTTETLLSTAKSVRVGPFTTRGSPIAHAQELFSASDRSGISWVSTGQAWIYSGGTHYAAIASRPADLTVNDVAYRFVDTTTDTQAEYLWSGTEWLTVDYLQEVSDTNDAAETVVQLLSHLSTAAPAVNMAIARQMRLGQLGGTAVVYFKEAVKATDTTGASEDANWLIYLMQAGTLTNLFTLTSLGSLTINGDYLWKSGTANAATLAHANGSARTYTFSDADGNVTYQTAALTSGNILKGGGGALVVDSGVSILSLPDVLFDHFADVGNGTTVETDLYADTIPAAQLATDGAKILSEYSGIFVLSATATRQLRAYFGGTLIFDTGTLSITGTNASWDVCVTVIRESSSVVRCAVTMATSSAALAAYAVYTRVTGLTLANTQILKLTGQAAGVDAATNDIVSKLGYVEYKPAA